MRRAEELGCSPDEAKARTPEREFRNWLVWYAHEPSVGDRIDALTAFVVATIINAAPFRSGRPVNPNRLLPRRWDRPEDRRPDAATLAEKLLACFRLTAAAGTDKR